MQDATATSAFRVMFGPEPEPVCDPEVEALTALLSVSSSMAGGFDEFHSLEYRGTDTTPTEGDLFSEIAQSGDRIRAVMTEPPVGDESVLRVVLQGRTTAGKSTLLESLSRGDGARRGHGAQKTTHDVCERPIVELPGVTMVDVPGVGAADGDADREVALAQLSRADLVLWLATNEAPKNDTVDALRHIAMLGKPVIVAINCRQSLDVVPHRERFLNDPDSVYVEAEAIMRTVERHLAAEGLSSIAWVALHADGAFRATRGESDSDALRHSSRIDKLLDVLRTQVGNASQRRFLRKVDAIRAQIVDEHSRLGVVIAALETEIQRRTGMLRAREARLGRVLEGHGESIRADLRAAVERRRHWYNTVDLERDVESAWEAEVSALREEVSDHLERAGTALAADLNSEDEAVRSDWALKDFSPQVGDQRLQLAGMGSVWANRGLKIAILGVGVLLAIPTGGQSLWLTGLTLGGSVVFQSQSKRILRLIDRKLPNAAERTRRRREEIRRRTTEVLDALLTAALDAIAGQEAQVRKAVNDSLHRDAEVIRSLEASQSEWADLSQRVVEGMADLDLVTAQNMLTLLGRGRAAASVTRASRSPRLGILVEVDERSYAELALFPPASVEPICPSWRGARGPATAGAVQTAPGLGVSLISASADVATFAAADRAGAEELDRLSELLSRFSGATVNVVATHRTGTQRGT